MKPYATPAPPVDLTQTQRRMSAVRPSPHVPAQNETGQLCTICNYMLIRVPAKSVCICQNSHVHSMDFIYLWGGI